MLPEIKKILFTSNLSDASKYAFSYAASIAGRYCASIVFLYVMEDVPQGAKAFLDPEMLSRIRTHARDSAKNSLISKRQDMSMIQSELTRFCEDAQNRLQNGTQRFVTSEVVVTEGNIVDQILIAVKEYDCDAIVMGSERHGLFSQAKPGNIVKGVLRRSDRLVVVAPPPPGK